MAQLTINTGSSAGAGDGDSLYTAFNKVNTNFTELYSKVTVLENGTIAVLGALKGTIVGDDSTILVDGVSSSINLDGTVKGNIIPDATEAYDIGSSSKRFKDLYLKGTTINLGGQTISATGSGITTSGTLTATAVTTTAPSTLSGTFTGDVTGSVFADDSTPIIDGVDGIVVGNVRNGLTTTGSLRTNQISNDLLAPMLMTATDSGLVITNTNLSNPGAIPGSNLEIHSQNNAVEITGNSYVSIISGSAGGPYADMDIYGDVLTLNGGQVYYNHTNQAFSGTVDFSSATVTGTNFLTSYTETDPVVGAITGLVKADGAGNISAAVAGTDYAPIDDPTFTTKITTPNVTFSANSSISVGNVGDLSNEAISIITIDNTSLLYGSRSGTTLGGKGAGSNFYYDDDGTYRAGLIRPDVIRNAGKIPKLTIDANWTRHETFNTMQAYSGGDSVIDIKADEINLVGGVDFTGATVTGLSNSYIKAAGHVDVSSPITASADLNVASVTSSATGKYDITFTTPLPNANYVVMLSVQTNVSSNNYTVQYYNRSTTGFQVQKFLNGTLDGGASGNFSFVVIQF
jgi:hypothetical protein